MSTIAKIGVVSCLLAMTLGAVTKDLYTLTLNGVPVHWNPRDKQWR